jgi:hypothetical protein
LSGHMLVCFVVSANGVAVAMAVTLLVHW